MNMNKHRRAVGVFTKPEDAQLALQGLKDVDFPMNRVSVIAKDTKEENDIFGVEFKQQIDNKTDKSAVAPTATTAVTDGLADLGILRIPGVGSIMLSATVGSIMLAGAEATTIASTLGRNPIATATKALTGALVNLGIPENNARIYSYLVGQGYYLLILNGDEREIAIAEMIFRNRGVEDWGTYDMSAAASSLLNRRYQYGVGLFFVRQDVENALNDLRKNGFPMEQVNLVAKNTTNLGDIAGVPIIASQYDFAAFEIPNDIAKHYNYRVVLGDYLVLLSGTAIQLAAARNILEQHQIQNYATFHPNLVNSTTVGQNYLVISKNA